MAARLEPAKHFRWLTKTPGAIAPYLYVLPALSVLVLFTLVPLAYTFYLSTTSWDLISPAKHFVGAANYQRLLQDQRFGQAFWNTSCFAAGTVPTQIALALGAALLLNTQIRLRGLFRAAFFLPVIVPIMVVTIVWLFIFSPSFGILNYLLSLVGLPPLGWLSDPHWALPALMIMTIWKNFGYHTVIFLAGLQGIPLELLEAAYIDGANRWQGFWKITFPLLGPTTFLVLIMSLIGSFQVYETVVLTTNGGPAGATTVIVFELYQNAFVFFNMGYAAAMTYVLLAFLFVLTLLQFRTIGTRIYYS